jgi:hypothetical protein
MSEENCLEARGNTGAADLRQAKQNRERPKLKIIFDLLQIKFIITGFE